MVLVTGSRGRVCGRWHAGARVLVIDLHGDFERSTVQRLVDRGPWTSAPSAMVIDV